MAGLFHANLPAAMLSVGDAKKLSRKEFYTTIFIIIQTLKHGF